MQYAQLIILNIQLLFEYDVRLKFNSNFYEIRIFLSPRTANSSAG